MLINYKSSSETGLEGLGLNYPIKGNSWRVISPPWRRRDLNNYQTIG